MPVSFRNVLPVVTAVVATLFLATAMPRDALPEPAFEVALPETSADVQHCVTRGRDADACLDEATGKALIERAERVARNDDLSRRASR
jgi:hypothetical protein